MKKSYDHLATTLLGAAPPPPKKKIKIRQYKNINKKLIFYVVGGSMASWLVRSLPERAVRVRALAGDIVLVFSMGKTGFTLTVSLGSNAEPLPTFHDIYFPVLEL